MKDCCKTGGQAPVKPWAKWLKRAVWAAVILALLLTGIQQFTL